MEGEELNESALRTLAAGFPKVELHAHLAGSIPDELLLEMLEEDRSVDSASPRASAVPPPVQSVSALLHATPSDGRRSLEECFSIFGAIHRCIRSGERLRRAVRAVLEFYSDDGCVYLELRTTPRRLDDLSEYEYLLCVLATLSDWHRGHIGGMQCRLLVSVNRAAPTAAAEAALAWADELSSLPQSHPCAGLTVGVELSGNPEKASFAVFEPYFRALREKCARRMPITLHFAEVPNDEEAHEMLAFKPDRFGHAVCMSDSVAKCLVESRIPVEACLTSNLITRSVSAASEHPILGRLAGHPFALCCDDAGVFRTSLSEEYFQYARALASKDGIVQLSDVRDALVAVTEKAIDMSFADGFTKRLLLARLPRDHGQRD